VGNRVVNGTTIEKSTPIDRSPLAWGFLFIQIGDLQKEIFKLFKQKIHSG